MSDLEIRTGDVDLAIGIMREVAQWCIDVGKPMWDLQELTWKELLQAPRDEGSFVVGWCDGRPAASMILQWFDPEFWPEVKENESGFIHKLCVRRDFAGRSLSMKMVGHAAKECRKRAIDFVRLDTDFTKPRLCALYEKMGFVRVGRRIMGGRDYALFELKLAGFKSNWPRMKVV